MFVKIKDMQRFIREKIDFNKKKSCLEILKVQVWEMFAKNTPSKKNPPKKQTSFKCTQTNKMFLKLTPDFTIRLYNHVFI